ncbi:MAG: hypothetical protein KIT02_00965 [Devosia sp.]|uniref:hypothetical protein n=1 Tax=Devosia sp. TaxID=1871048 RepID=UPI0024C7F970|nr:hypothetical protein [Devosia sp.]UYN99846.1 MAG: hypothetical protein KIT02_00965 [Devosia sp.]
MERKPQTSSNDVRGGVVPPARDPDVAVTEEYAHFKALGTREALELFIQRHPKHRLAEQARQDLKLLD